jgi:hypothetical protein
MEKLQGNQFIGILNKQKCYFFFYKNGEQVSRTGPVWGLVQFEGENVGEECKRVNMGKILCSHL